RYGDEIVRFGGRAIRSANAFQNALGIFPKGWRVPMSFRRDGKQYDVLVRLAGVHTEAELIQKATGRPRQAPMPIPKPGERPGNKPGGKQEPRKDRDDDGPIPLPDDHPTLRPAPMPEVVAKHYEERRGYANYYFNRLHRDRVWKAWTARSGLGAAQAVWTISGSLGADAQYRFQVSEAGVLLKLPLRETKWTATDEISGSLLPEGSGGLLPALFLWRRLAVDGPEKYGEVYYLGTAPFAGHPEPADVLVGLHGGVECHFYVDPKESLLLGLELFAPGNPDPCEIYLSDYRHMDGRWMPQRMEVRCGDVRFADFSIQRFEVEPLP
ncbi:MAG: hypothetical protein NUV77_13475, partial [Thermoguttaceae bacterium]|nr:hypothetical protein [Thermoguttaceae bacterium]